MHEGVSTGVSGLLAVQLYIHNLSRRMTGPVPDNETGEIHSAILTLVIKCGREGSSEEFFCRLNSLYLFIHEVLGIFLTYIS